MKITYISQRTIPAPLTGSERYIHDLASFLDEKYSVEIIATGNLRGIDSMQTYSNVDIRAFKEFPIKYLTSPITFAIRKLQKQWLLDLYSKSFNGFVHSTSWGFFSLSMKDYLESHNYDLIHAAAVPTGTSWLAWRVSKRRKVPFVFTSFLHYEIMDFRVPWVKELLEESSIIIAVTNKEREKLIESGVNDSKIRVIPLGINSKIYARKNTSSFREKNGLDEDLFIILIPRKAEEKGTFDTLRAIVNLSEKYKKLGLILLDKTRKHDEFRLARYIQILLSKGVKVLDLGFVKGQNLVDAYQACDVVVEPTRVDSFGIVFLEAWACGKPVIAADFGPISEIVLDNVNGLLVEFGNQKEIEKAIISLIDNVKLKRKLGEYGRLEVMKKYSIENMVTKTEEVYNSL